MNFKKKEDFVTLELEDESVRGFWEYLRKKKEELDSREEKLKLREEELSYIIGKRENPDGTEQTFVFLNKKRGNWKDFAIDVLRTYSEISITVILFTFLISFLVNNDQSEKNKERAIELRLQENRIHNIGCKIKESQKMHPYFAYVEIDDLKCDTPNLEKIKED
jgi:hypothetical protein